VPGRIEVLGKHTDYAGGRSIVAAVEKGFCFAASARKDNIVRILDAATNEKTRFQISSRLETRSRHWSNYPRTVARRIADNFTQPLRGADIAFAADLPPAAGLSSSSALIVGFFLILSDLNALHLRPQYTHNIKTPEDLAAYLAAIENGQTFATLKGRKGVGTFGGSEDHTAILCSRPGSLSQYSYAPVRFEQSLALPARSLFAIASSGVTAQKTGSAMKYYNRLSNLAADIVRLWNTHTGRSDPNLAAAIAAHSTACHDLRQLLQQTSNDHFTPHEHLQRFEHFLAESEQIVPKAAHALAKGDINLFAEQTARSQQLAEQLLDNQVPQTIFLANSAIRLGALAASAFGAGFGGSVWALIKNKNAGAFLENWATLYQQKFPKAVANAAFFLTLPGPPACQL